MNENPKVWLIGENNPYGPDPRFALYPLPERSAGGRLCHVILGMQRTDYLRAFERANLLSQSRWSAPAARNAAMALRERVGDGRVILFGAKVHDAWCWHARPGRKWVPFSYVENGVLALPHPSGLCRLWNEPGAIERARAAVLELAPWLSGTIGRAGGT